jgi:type I restriction-modification system DNA methylase subunit
MTTEEILQSCTVHSIPGIQLGRVVKLPPENLPRDQYEKVAKKLNLIGGKWNRKHQGFLFPLDPTELLGKVAEGKVVNEKKTYQFFGTPDELADRMVELLQPQDSDGILEPSAGNGALVKALNRYLPGKLVQCYELMPVNRIQLEQIPTVILLGEDFLKSSLEFKYDRIIANPPFSKNQDIEHIKRMYDLLRPGGRLVTIASTHWTFANGKKETAFREWLEQVNASIEELPRDTFKESGTTVGATLILIER